MLAKGKRNIVGFVILGGMAVAAAMFNEIAQLWLGSSRNEQPSGHGPPTTLQLVVQEAASAAAGMEPLHPPQGLPLAVDVEDEALWIAQEGEPSGTHSIARWNPRTGQIRRYSAKDVNLSSIRRPSITASAGRMGLLVLGARLSADHHWDDDPRAVLLLDGSNRALTGALGVARAKPWVLMLRDGSALLVSGVVGQKDGREIFTNAVEHVAMSGDELAIRRLPDVPGQVRRGVGLVELLDGQVMALGGLTVRPLGDERMTAETYVLDVHQGTWRSGPTMLEPRTNASATLLPDGSVLVAGGWTREHTWQGPPARGTERWDPRTNSFSPGARLVNGVARQLAMWIPGPNGPRLVLAGGAVSASERSHVLQAYDPVHDDWRSAGASCSHRGEEGQMWVPVVLRDRAYVWCWSLASQEWSLVAPHLPGRLGEASARVGEAGVALQRAGMAFLPPSDGRAGFAAGGDLGGAYTAAVDGVWPDGRIQAVASLGQVRTGAQIFRMPDGSVVVVGGTSTDATGPPELFLPLELLPSGVALPDARWLSADLNLPTGTAVGQLHDGSLVAVTSSGAVLNIKVRLSSDGSPEVQRVEMPPLTRYWRAGPSHRPGSTTVKGLSDGRIIVAGGEAQTHKIALLQERSFEPDAPDDYMGLGAFLPARTYEIYDPVAKAWRESAPSRTENGLFAILDDGRVVKSGTLPAEPGSESTGTAFLEISASDGSAWRELATAAQRATHMLFDPARPFSIDGQLFLSGKDKMRNLRLQCFDPSAKQWQVIWEAPESHWREHLGRIVLRDLPNAKRLVIPIDGL